MTVLAREYGLDFRPEYFLLMITLLPHYNLSHSQRQQAIW